MKKKELRDLLEDEYGRDPEVLKGMSKEEMEELLLEITDVSSWIPNETFDDFMDHEARD